MEAAMKSDDHVISAAAFVEGGVQEACDDACSICLEEFSHNDPSTVTNCKHEFHLQCILEWCQRSSNCPMCWQSISLKDATSQELLEAVEHERRIKATREDESRFFYHPALGDFELHHLALGAGHAEFQEQMLQQLAAAAFSRGHRNQRQESQRNRSSSQAHHPFFIFSGSNSSQGGISSSSTSLTEDDSEPAAASTTNVFHSNISLANRQRIFSESRSFASQSSPRSRDTAGPSDLQSMAESLRSKLNAWSTRYKESFSRNTRGWKERLFARSNSMAELGSEDERQENAGIASVSHIMEGLQNRENNGPIHGSGPSTRPSRLNMNNSDNHITQVTDGRIPASCATSSASN